MLYNMKYEIIMRFSFFKDGMFLIRDSNKLVEQPYTLVVYRRDRLFNVPITTDAQGEYSATNGKSVGIINISQTSMIYFAYMTC